MNVDGVSPQPQPKEFVMNEAPQLEILDLGDAKEQTKGWVERPLAEIHPTFTTRDPG